MLLDLLLFATFGTLGVWLQVRTGGGETLRRRLWNANYALLIPAGAVFAFLSIELDATLLATVACGVAAWWLTVGAAWGWARLVARDRPRRGALTLVGGFPNTGFIGFPLAHLAFGTDGLRLAVVYDQVSLVVPAIVVATVIAQRHVTRPAVSGAELVAIRLEERRALQRTVLLSPPLWTVVVVVIARLTVQPEPIELDALGEFVGRAAGPVGFLLLGLSIPLHGFAHGRRDVVETVGAVLVRIAVAPALVWVVATATRTDVPTALYLIAAMPTAFHAMVISRVRGLDAATARLGVLVSTTVVVGVTVTLAALGVW